MVGAKSHHLHKIPHQSISCSSPKPIYVFFFFFFFVPKFLECHRHSVAKVQLSKLDLVPQNLQWGS